MAVDVGSILPATMGNDVGTLIVIPAQLGVNAVDIWVVETNIRMLAAADNDRPGAGPAGDLGQHSAVDGEEVGTWFTVGSRVGRGPWSPGKRAIIPRIFRGR